MTSGWTVKGLKKQIVIVEEIIEKKKGKDVKIEKDLIKAWKTYLPGGRNHHKLSQNALE